MKGLFLIFHTDYTAEVKKGNIEDGRVRIGHKEWILDDTKPFLVETLFGATPLYILKWDSLRPIGIKDFSVQESPITPEMMKRSVELKFWHFLLKRFAGPTVGISTLYLLLTVMLGMVAMYFLVVFKLIPI